MHRFTHNIVNFYLFIFLIAIILADSLLSNVSDFLTQQISSFGGLLFFAISVATYGIGQYLILKLVHIKLKSGVRTKYLKIINLIVTIAQYLILAIAIVLLLQIFMSQQYLTLEIMSITAISYSLSIILLGLLVFKLSVWYTRSQSSIIILLYVAGFLTSVVRYLLQP